MSPEQLRPGMIVWTWNEEGGYHIKAFIVINRKRDYRTSDDPVYYEIQEIDEPHAIYPQSQRYLFSTREECREALLNKLRWCRENAANAIKLRLKEIVSRKEECDYYENEILKLEQEIATHDLRKA